MVPPVCKHILLIDDNLAEVLLMEQAFASLPKPESRMVHVVHDGVTGLAAARQQGHFANLPRPDIILLDLHMPEMDGLSFLHERNQDATLRTIAVVVLSTSNESQKIQQAYLAGANAYLQKPVNFRGVCDLVASIDQFWLQSCELVH